MTWKPVYRFTCPYCGRDWNGEGMSRTSLRTRAGKSNAVGFIKSGANNHIAGCRDKTPAERRATNVRDEKRWAKYPPTSCVVRNDPRHPGLQGDR